MLTKAKASNSSVVRQTQTSCKQLGRDIGAVLCGGVDRTVSPFFVTAVPVSER